MLFCKLDCSQAYHVLKTAEQKLVEILAFTFVSRTFSYLRLAQSLNRSFFSFSSFLREYIDRDIKADKCPQCVDDLGFATHDAEDFKTNMREIFQCKKPIKLINEVMGRFCNINKAPDTACGLWLKQPMPNRRYEAHY